MIEREESQSKNIYENDDVSIKKSADIEKEISGNENDSSAVNKEKSGNEDDIFAAADFEDHEDTDAPPVGIIWTGEEWIRYDLQQNLIFVF